MHKTIRMEAEKWLFARPFAYIEGQYDDSIFAKGHFFNKWKTKPVANTSVPYLSVDDASMYVNVRNIQGEWIHWDWEHTRSLRIYHLMQPWKSSIYSIFREVDVPKARRRNRRYFRMMKRQYKKFDYDYRDLYENEYSLIIEGRKGNAQIWLPREWVENPDWSWVLTFIEEKASVPIYYFREDKTWSEKHLEGFFKCEPSTE